MFNIYDNSKKLIIENENLSPIHIVPSKLEAKLQGYDKLLNIDLVVIALPNCKPFAEVFFKQGVSHVISFKV